GTRQCYTKGVLLAPIGDGQTLQMDTPPPSGAEEAALLRPGHLDHARVDRKLRLTAANGDGVTVRLYDLEVPGRSAESRPGRRPEGGVARFTRLAPSGPPGAATLAKAAVRLEERRRSGPQLLLDLTPQ